ncbi:MAG: D-alanyl-D-alanine carboxypeptidase family protein [Thermoleophilia bacterium]
MFRGFVVLAAAVLALMVATASADAVPEVDAVAYALVDPSTGVMLASRNAQRELPMASTTKVMTALVTLDDGRLDRVCTVPAAAEAVGGSTGSLRTGERMPVRELLTALLVPSGNDAAVTLARCVGGGQAAFVRLMNAKARELGLTHTHYANPHGLDAPGHHTTPADLISLAQVAMRDPLFRGIVASRRASIPGPGGVGRRTYESENELLDLDPDADGIKTGMTDGAGYSLVAHARRPSLGVDLYLAMIGAPDSDTRAREAMELFDWGFAQYARGAFLRADETVGSLPVDGRPGVSVPYRAESPLTVPLRLDAGPVVERIVAPAELRPPVAAGQVVGTVTLRQGDRVLGRRKLVATRSAGSPGVWDRIRDGWNAVMP